MELFQTVSHPSQATSLSVTCLGTISGLGPEEQQERHHFFGKPGQAAKHSSFRDSLLVPNSALRAETGPQFTAFLTTSLKPPGEKNGDPDWEKIASMFKVKAKRVAEIDPEL